MNCVAAVLLVLNAFVKVPPATSIVVAPSALGVNVAVYVVPDPEKLLSVPPLTTTSPAAKFVVLWLAVKVTDREVSADESPSFTSAAVIVIVGAVLYVQLNCVAAVLSTPVEAFVKVLLATSIVVAPCAVGVKVAV